MRFRITFFPQVDVEVNSQEELKAILQRMGVKHNLKVVYGSPVSISGVKEGPMDINWVAAKRLVQGPDGAWREPFPDLEGEEDGQEGGEPGENTTPQ